MHAAKRTRAAALVSKHGPTCRRVAQSLGAAGVHVRATPFPSELPLDGLEDVVALLVDLDVSPGEPPAMLVAEARQAYRGVPILATAGVDSRARLLDALCESDVHHVIPKRGALTLPRGGMPVIGTLEGPDEHDLFAAIRRLLEGPESPGVSPYLLSGAPVHEVSVRTSDDKDGALEAIIGFAESMGLAGEKLRRVELSAEELLMNALYDAPRNSDGSPRNANLDRRLAVSLGSDETVKMRYGCDGQTLAVAVADPFGSLSKQAVTERLRKVREGIPRPNAGVAGAGLGLVMTYSVANQLIFAVAPGRLTEVTAVLHVGGSNRAAQERGTAVHFYVGGEGVGE
ncbi:MAG: response regulator receiver protein [Myxococcales bacterium]|nr:response regulator receiver protein [Myxococcales bacterium]